DVADRLLGMVAEVAATEARVRVQRRGSFGVLGADIATPLAMALTEILQNAVEHGLGSSAGEVTLTADRREGRLRVVVEDDGRGLPADFDADQSAHLGLQIVRTLVVGELGGSLELNPRTSSGTSVVLDLASAHER